ncbi:uncharacterized protein [Solanum lycopersicum]|uniref:uncharacterized protein isoform X3 n=1 Tax=Solanum lycopersicum TaxID=4081 RepID=UPI000532B62C|nr:probable splicing factor, arginine/serine-rich 7 isoform X3 [Solanum lycopersicum]
MSSPELVSIYFFACCYGLISEYRLIELLQSQSNGSQHFRVKANYSGDQYRHGHRQREDYKDKSTRSHRRNDDNEDYSRSRNHKFDRRQDRGGRYKGETCGSRSRSKDRSHEEARSRSSSPLPPKSGQVKSEQECVLAQARLHIAMQKWLLKLVV